MLVRILVGRGRRGDRFPSLRPAGALKELAKQPVTFMEQEGSKCCPHSQVGLRMRFQEGLVSAPIGRVPQSPQRVMPLWQPSDSGSSPEIKGMAR